MTVREVTTRVLVDGVERQHESVEWTGRSSGALPTHLGGGGSRWDSTAEVVWWHDGVHTTLPSPWGPGAFAPPDGSRIQVYCRSTGAERLVFTGIVSASSASGSPVTSKCIDTRDRMRRTIRTEPVSYFTPPHEDGWSQNTRTIVTPIWAVYQIARTGGLNATYRPSGTRTIVDVPLVGAVWAMPGGGRVIQSSRYSDSSNPNYGPKYVPSDWGVGISDGFILIDPSAATQTSRRYRVGLTVASTHSAATDIAMYHSPGGAYWAVHVTADRTAQMRTVTSAGAVNIQASIALGSALAFAVTVRGTDVIIETDDGRSATAAAAVPTSNISQVVMWAQDGASIGGLTIVDPGNTGGSFVTFYDGPELIAGYGLGARTVTVLPSIRDDDALKTLMEIADQTMCAVKMDPLGRLIFRSMDVIWAGPVTHDVSVDREILGLSWETDAQSAASQIAVRHRVWGVGRSQRESITVATLGGSLDPGEEWEEWITVPDDEEWFYPDYSTSLAGVAYGRYGSWRGATEEDGNGDPVPSGAFTLYLNAVTPWATKVRVTASKAIRLQIGSTSNIHWTLRGLDGLLFRARGRAVAREDVLTTGNGPAWAQAFEHDGSKWLADENAQEVADWLVSLGLGSRPRLNDLTLLLDETIEPWSIIRVRSEQLHGVTLELLVEEVAHVPVSGESRVSGVVRDVTVSGATYRDLAAAWRAGSYSGLATAWAGDDYDDLAAQPLKGAPS